MQHTATPNRRSVNNTSRSVAVSVLFFLVGCFPPPPKVHTAPPRVQRCPVVVHVIDVHEACGALARFCRGRQPVSTRTHTPTRTPMCIADWGCDDGYLCDTDTFECDYALE